MIELLKANKTTTGVIVTIIAGGLYACPQPWCQTAFHWLVVVGPALVSAGLLPSDFHVKQAQDYAANGGDEKRAQ